MHYQRNKECKKNDDSQYNCIVFDEIYFSDINKLRKILKYSNDNPDKIIVATGDTDQLKPISEYSNVKEYKSYANECINLIFNYGIVLYENKRLKTQEDRDKLKKKMKQDIFNENIPITDIIEKYF